MTPARRRAIHAAMVRFAEGDRAAFRDVFQSLWPILAKFAAGSLSNRSDAEDVAQRALIKLFAQIMDMDREKDGVAWAMAIAAYEVMTFRRALNRRREQNVETLMGVPDDDPLADQRLAKEQIRAAVRQAIGDLSPQDQEALTVMLDEVPVTFSETLRKRRYRALQRFRALWGKAHG
jgi:RNA polymerase sigma-70 factor, ECF subfamily